MQQAKNKDSSPRQIKQGKEKPTKIGLDFGMNLLSSFQNKIISNFQTVSHQIHRLFIKQKDNYQAIQELQKNTKEINKFLQSLKLKRPQSSKSPKKDYKQNFQLNNNLNMIQIRTVKNEQFGINTQKKQLHQMESQYDKETSIKVQTIQNETEEEGSLLQSYITQLVSKKVQQLLNLKKSQNITKESQNTKAHFEKEIQIQINKKVESFKQIKTPTVHYQNPLKIQDQTQNKQIICHQNQNKIKKSSNIIPPSKIIQQNQKTIAVNCIAQVQNNKPLNNNEIIQIKKIQNFQMPITNLSDLEQNLLKQLSLKFMQLNARVYKIQENALNDLKINSKKFNDIQKSVQQGNLQLKKYSKTGQSYEQQVQKLRNELNQYKLKKQSKLMKLINASSNGAGSNKNSSQQSQINKYIDYMSQKIEYLLKAVNELVPKQRYNEDIEYIHEIFGSFRKKVANVINEKELSQKLSLMQKRIIEELAICFQAKNQDENKNKLLKLLQEKIQNVQKNTQNSSQEQNNQTESQKEQSYISKILNTQKLLNSILEQFDQLKKSHKKLKNVQYPELQTQVAQHKNLVNQLKVKINNHENFFKDMNNEYNKKIHEIQGQIINDQQNLDKINNQLKFYKFTNFRSDTTKAESVSPHQSKQETLANQISSSIQHTKTDEINKEDFKSQQYMLKNNLNLKKSLQMSGSTPLTLSNPQNQIQQLKKKIGKMSIIIQTLKSQMTSLRGDLYRDLQAVRVNQDKKADWDTFKKGMAYFDQRIKETNQHINQILLTIQNTEKQESTAAKKGWTCLCCDRDIKSFEGRLGQAKFMSVFPGKHDSPRIGGYYKQNSKQKQYNQLYLNKSRRNSIQKMSKEDLNQIK